MASLIRDAISYQLQMKMGDGGWQNEFMTKEESGYSDTPQLLSFRTRAEAEAAIAQRCSSRENARIVTVREIWTLD